MDQKKNETVLVTGGSGFVGTYCIIKLLSEGYTVRTTVRSLKREPDVRATLKAGGAEAGDKLSFYAADLGADTGWKEAIAGCDYVLHVASPFPPQQPKNEDELIIPARDGALRVLRAARGAKVKRVVLTSSFAAIGYGYPQTNKPFDETSWSNLNGSGVTPYVKSKTLAERAAWDFIAKEGNGLELSVINPTGIFGPVLNVDFSTSIGMLKNMLDGKVKQVPNIAFGVVDVRDVADIHLLAMKNPAAKGERFLATAADCMTMLDGAKILKAGLGEAGKNISTKPLPTLMLRIAALMGNPAAKQTLPNAGKIRHLNNEKAKRVLGWKPHSNEEALIATAESLVRLGK